MKQLNNDRGKLTRELDALAVILRQNNTIANAQGVKFRATAVNLPDQLQVDN